jgi:hypothetical protein
MTRCSHDATTASRSPLLSRLFTVRTSSLDFNDYRRHFNDRLPVTASVRVIPDDDDGT